MEKKKKTQVAVNMSSGAEKVEEVQKTVKKKETAPTDKVEAQMDVKKMNAQSTNGKAEKESKEAKARVERALKRKQEKERKREERAKLAKKRAQERKERAEKRKAALDELIRERAHAKANRNQKKAKEKQERHTHVRNQRGYGGWLAAVIVLGATTLGLTTALTVGALEMSDMNDGLLTSNRATTYELIEVTQHLDNDLDRLRVSASSLQQQRILTDLLVQARLAEADLERLPVCAESCSRLTEFYNRVARESERMLAKLRLGEQLTGKDEEILQSMYEHAERVKTELGVFTSNVTDKDFLSFIKKGEGEMQSLFRRLEDATLPENADMPPQIMPRKDGAGTERTPIPGEEQGAAAITPAQAEEMCKTYFSAYKINEFQCIGETVARGYTAYNLQGYDDKGTLLFAELDYKNGELIRFDYYEECTDENFDMDNAQTIAENFLEKLGYEDMTAVRVRENSTDLDFTYLYENDGVVYYPDAIHVKVCRSRGVVTGFDASKYLRNHTHRGELNFTLPIEKAQSKLHDGVAVESVRKAVVATPRGERAAYEFVCAYNDQRYVIYTDATNGEELAILNVNTIG